MAITALTRDWGPNPSLVRMVCTDTLSTITTAGYLTDEEPNIELINNGTFEWVATDLVLIHFSPNLIGFFTRDATNEAFIAISAPSTLSNTLASGRMFVGNVSNIATGVDVSGAFTMSNTGVATLGTGVVSNTNIAADAQIALTKLADGAPTAIFHYDGAGNATSNAMSGDVTLNSLAAATIAANAITAVKIAADAVTTVKILNSNVTTAKIADANVTLAKLATGITPSHVVKFAGQPTTVGGSASESFSIIGTVDTDLAFCQMVDNGNNNVTILQATVTSNNLNITFSGNPGNDAVFNYQILRAAT